LSRERSRLTICSRLFANAGSNVQTATQKLRVRKCIHETTLKVELQSILTVFKDNFLADSSF